MSNNFNKVIESLSSFSGADLDDLKDAIDDELRAREHKQVIELREKAIKALDDYFQAGGCISDDEGNCSFEINKKRLSLNNGCCLFLK